MPSWIQENKHRFPRFERGADGVVRKISPDDGSISDPSSTPSLGPDQPPPAVRPGRNEPALASSVWK
jgi:hypothetical protein